MLKARCSPDLMTIHYWAKVKNPLTRAFFSQGDAKDMWPPHTLRINNNPDFGGGNHITLHYIQYDILSLLDFKLVLKNTPVRN